MENAFRRLQLIDPAVLTSNNPSRRGPPETDDPLWEEGGLMACDSAILFGPPIRFNIDCRGFVSLVKEEYSALSIQLCLAPSAFSYFCNLCLWYYGVAGDTPAESKLLTMMRHYDIHIPERIATYLQGLDFHRSKMKMMSPNRRGHFGRIDKQTHVYYQTLPAPAILIQRILEDVRYTRTKQGQIWDLPDIQLLRSMDAQPVVAPDSGSDSDKIEGTMPLPAPPANTNQPKVNVLGWYKAQELCRNKLFGLTCALKEIPENYSDLTFQIPTFCFNRCLFEFVLSKLENVRNHNMKVLPKHIT